MLLLIPLFYVVCLRDPHEFKSLESKALRASFDAATKKTDAAFARVTPPRAPIKSAPSIMVAWLLLVPVAAAFTLPASHSRVHRQPRAAASSPDDAGMRDKYLSRLDVRPAGVHIGRTRRNSRALRRSTPPSWTGRQTRRTFKRC